MNNYQLQIDDLKAQLEAEKLESEKWMMEYAEANRKINLARSCLKEAKFQFEQANPTLPPLITFFEILLKTLSSQKINLEVISETP